MAGIRTEEENNAIAFEVFKTVEKILYERGVHSFICDNILREIEELVSGWLVEDEE